MKPALHFSPAARRRDEAARWWLRLAENPTPDEKAQFQAWQAADPANVAAFTGLSAAMQDVEHFAGAPEVLALRSQALATARRSREVLRLRAFFHSRTMRAAGVALIAFVLGAAAYLGTRGGSTISTAIGERRTVALADGSHLSLDAATELRVQFTTDRRRLKLTKGRAKFDVARDALRPFTVEAGDKIVVAVGTSFSVELIAGEVRVALYEGRVEVLPAGAAADIAAAGTLIEPGRELISSARQAPQITEVDAQRSLAWESGDLAFADEPLALAVDRINRYAKQRIAVGDAAAAQVRISGVFHAGDTAAFIDGITRLFPVRAERQGGETTLISDGSRAGRRPQ